jgi:hypothetical protein
LLGLQSTTPSSGLATQPDATDSTRSAAAAAGKK